MTAQQTAEHEAREKLVSRREAGLEVERRSIDAEKERVAALELATSHRISDMSNRLRLVTAE